MNAMIRVLKGTLAVLALAGLGWLLRWMTAGSISGLRTYDLDSLTVLAVGTIAWIAYIWLALAVVLTVLEQIPGVVGELAGAVAGRITTKTARALLRSGLGVAAVTPLTIGAAHATPDTAHVRHTTQADPQSALPATYRATEAASRLHITGDAWTTEPASSVEVGGQSAANYRATEAASTLEIGGQNTAHYRETEAASSVEIGGQDAAHYRRTEAASPVEIGDQSATDYRATEAPSSVEIGGQDTGNYRSTEPASTVEIGGSPTRSDATAQHQATDSYRTTEAASTLPITQSISNPPTTSDRPADSARTSDGKPAASEQQPGGRPRVGVPDRPTDGAPTRYTELRPKVPVSIVVREGDSLWTIAARELGPTASPEAITARWHDWYAANRHVIGKNPDLILPGQILRTPPTHNGDHHPPHHQEQ